MSETRKIAAILVADIVGYSRLAGADEDRTLSRLRGLRSAFVFLMVAALAGLFEAAIDRRPTQDDINTTVRLVANIFVVMTSLVLGLMLNSAKNTFETDNRNVHALATDLILLDRTMKALGPQADEARRHLTEYVQWRLGPPNDAQ